MVWVTVMLLPLACWGEKSLNFLMFLVFVCNIPVFSHNVLRDLPTAYGNMATKDCFIIYYYLQLFTFTMSFVFNNHPQPEECVQMA